MRDRRFPRLLLGPLVAAALFVLPAAAHAAALVDTPVVTVSATSKVMLGEQATVVVSFDNNDATSRPGFGPFVDVLIRTADASGDPTHGLSLVGAPTLGAGGPTLAFQAFPCTTTPFNHPVLVDAAGAPVPVPPADCPVGSTFIHVTLPFGSFTSSQPSASVQLKLAVSNLANISGDGTDDLDVRARGGYRFGGDALDNPSIDMPVRGAYATAGASAAISPELFEISKRYVGPESETATGPNFVRQFRIDASVANGQQVDLLTLTDQLPDGIVVTGVTAIGSDSLLYGGTSLVGQLPIRTDGVRSLEAFWTGATFGQGPGTPVRTVLIDFYVPNVLSADTELLPGGADHTINNVGRLSGVWTPTGVADDGGAVTITGNSAPAPGLAIEAAALVVQKTRVAPANPKVGDTVQYEINGQVSDYYAVSGIVVDDSLADGLKIDTSIHPTLTVMRGGVAVGPAEDISAAPFYTYTSRLADAGTRDLQAFDIGAFLTSTGYGAPDETGMLRGGCVPAAPTSYDPKAAFESSCAAGALTFRLTYAATLLARYEEAPSAGKLVVARDAFDNVVTATGTVRDTSTAGWPAGGATANGSGHSFQLGNGVTVKRIYAINDVVCVADSCAAAAAKVVPGDTITYYLLYMVPAPGVDELKLRDFLPLPVLRVTAGAPTWSSTPVVTDADLAAMSSATVRPYTGSQLPKHTYSDTSVGMSSSVAGNSFTLDWGDTGTTLAANERIALLAKFTVNTDPFADALRLTNQLNVTTDNTDDAADRFDSYAEFTLREPNVQIRKGVGPTDNAPDDTFTGTVAAVNAPPAAPMLAGTPISAATAMTWDSNVTGLDAHDRVRYVVTVANTGGATAQNVDVCDALPTAGMVGGATPTVSNFTVFNQAGAVVTGALIGGQSAFFDCASSAGFTAIPAGEVRFVVYDLQVDAGASVLYTPIVNTARLSKFENVGSDKNFLTVPRTGAASATATRDASVSKTFVDTVTGLPIASPQSLTIGQKARYRVRVSLDEGTFGSLKVVDSLAAGLAFTSDPTVVTASGGILSCNMVACDATSFSGAKSVSDSVMTWNFGTVVNAQSSNVAARETIDIYYWVIMRDLASNTAAPATTLRNSAVVTHDACGGGTPRPNCPGAARVVATVVEPAIDVSKSVTPTVLDTDDVATWTITVPVTGATAHTVRITDTIPTGLNYVAGSIACIGASTCSVTGALVKATYASLASGQTRTITFQTRLDASAAIAGNSITNTATGTWLSLPDIANQCDTQTDCDERAYSDTGSASVNVAKPNVDKKLIASSDATTRMAPAPAHLAVGETAQYEVEIKVPEVGAPSMSLVDTVAPGLRFVRVDEIVLGSGTVATDLDVDGATGGALAGKLASIVTAANTSATNPANAPGGTRTSDGRQVGLHFGDVRNTTATPTTTTRSLLVRYTVVARNVVGNQRGTSLPNSAVLRYNSISSAAAVVQAQVVEPTLEIDKTMAPVSAGSTIYRVDLVARHLAGSNATAYDVRVGDTLPASLEVWTTAPGVAASASRTDITDTNLGTIFGDSQGSSAINVVADRLDVGETATLTFYVRIKPTHVVGDLIVNDADVTWSSLASGGADSHLPGGRLSACATSAVASPDCIERNGSGGIDDYAATDAVSMAPVPTVTKVRTSPTVATAPDAVVVGQTLRYEVRLTLPTGTTKAVKIDDSLDRGLAFPTSATGVTVTLPSGVTSSVGPPFDSTDITVGPHATDLADPAERRMQVDLGDITNANATTVVVTVAYDVVVANLAAVQDGTPAALDNVAVASYKPTGARVTLPGVTAASVVPREPVLRIVKTLTDDTAVSAPDGLVRVRVTVDHAPGNTVTAHDVVVSDALTGTGLSFVEPNVATAPTCAGTGVSCSVPTVTGSGSTAVISATATPLEAGDTVVLTFWAKVDPTHVVGTTITNTARADWTSMPGAVASICGAANCAERTGVDGVLGGGTLNDYRVTGSATHVDPVLAVEKTRTDPAPATTDKVVVGQTIAYRVAVTVPPGTSQAVTLDDVLDEGLAFPHAGGDAVVTPPAGVTTGAVTAVVGDAVSGANAASRRLQIGLGDVVNATARPQVVVVTYHAVVRNEASVQANPANAALDNVVGLDYTGNGAPITDSGEPVKVTEPNVKITKTIIPTFIDGGTMATIRLDLDSNGDATARGIVVQDVLPVRMRRMGVSWVAGFSPTCTIATPTVATASSPLDSTTCATVTGGAPVRDTVTIAAPDLAPGTQARIEFNVMLDTALTPGESVANTGSVTWRSMPIGQADVDVCPTAADCTGRTGAGGEPAAGIVNDYADSDRDVVAGATSSSIAGNAWHDVDNDGVRDPAEACIDGVTVTLTGTDMLGNAVNAVALTGGAVIDGATGTAYVPVANSACGAYRFDGLRPGTYTVTQTQPAGWLDGLEGALGSISTAPVVAGGSAGSSTSNDVFTGITLLPGTSSAVTLVDFGEIRPSSLAGIVWGEQVGGPENGILDAGADTPLGGVTVTLTGTDDRGNAVARTTTTAADGTYVFADVRPGAYQVTQTQPAAWVTGGAVIGAGPTTVGVIDDTNRFSGIRLAQDEQGTRYDFWEVRRANVRIAKLVVAPGAPGGVVGRNTSFTWRITVTNDGPSPVTNLQFEDDLAAIAEAGLTIQSVTPSAGTTCSTWTAAPVAPVTRNLTCATPTLGLAPANVATVDLLVRADATPPTADAPYVNTARVTSIDQRGDDPADNTATSQVIVRDGDIGVVKTGNATRLLTGQQIEWNVRVTNNGPGYEPAVTLTDQLPAQAMVLSVTPVKGTCVTGAAGVLTLECSLGAMAAGDVIDIKVVAMLPEAGTYRNVATVTLPGTDRDPTNQTSTHTVVVTAPGVADCTVEGVGAITGTSGDDIICGSGGDDVITCSGGNDIIVAGGGNDVVTCTPADCAGGTQAILGGAGNDVITVNCPGTTINGGDGDDTITLNGSDPGIAFGGAGNDRITGGGGADTLCGNEGNDVILAGAGNDVVDGGAGNDTVDGQAGNDRLYGGVGNDKVRGGTGNDRIFGGAGNDKLYGEGGSDTIYGEAGNDLIDGGADRDSVHGGDGNDTFRMKDKAADRIIGGRGRDTLYRDKRLDRWITIERLR